MATTSKYLVNIDIKYGPAVCPNDTMKKYVLITSGWIILSLLFYIIVIAMPEKFALNNVKIILQIRESQKLDVYSVATAMRGRASAQPRIMIQAFDIKFLFLLSSLSEIMPALRPETMPRTERLIAFIVEKAVLNYGKFCKKNTGT